MKTFPPLSARRAPFPMNGRREDGTILYFHFGNNLRRSLLLRFLSEIELTDFPLRTIKPAISVKNFNLIGTIRHRHCFYDVTRRHQPHPQHPEVDELFVNSYGRYSLHFCFIFDTYSSLKQSSFGTFSF